jgi:hypothetical protein
MMTLHWAPYTAARRDHGKWRPSLTNGWSSAEQTENNRITIMPLLDIRATKRQIALRHYSLFPVKKNGSNKTTKELLEITRHERTRAGMYML